MKVKNVQPRILNTIFVKRNSCLFQIQTLQLENQQCVHSGIVIYSKQEDLTNSIISTKSFRFMILQLINGHQSELILKMFSRKSKFCKTRLQYRLQRIKSMYLQERMPMGKFCFYFSYRADTGLVLHIMQIREKIKAPAKISGELWNVSIGKKNVLSFFGLFSQSNVVTHGNCLYAMRSETCHLERF